MANPDWSDLPKEHNLAKFAAELPEILKNAAYDEMYGVKLEAPSEEHVTGNIGCRPCRSKV